ncbi:MAG: hypothetical protein N2Z65_00420 [Clostridiales bacterium]|nr:hypothetical protein [Clostridiales bacterium]
MDTNGSLSFLDQIRFTNGIDHCKTIFREIAEKEREKAIHYINQTELYFASLFFLFPEIDELNLYENLSRRNYIALGMCAKILEIEKPFLDIKQLGRKNGRDIPLILNWMFTTGSAEDGINSEYDRVLDAVAALLVIDHKDTSILPFMVNLIFNRNKKGLLNHDLIWCFMKSCNPHVLKLSADYLLSYDPKDVELACKLLSIKMPDAEEWDDMRGRYNHYIAWLNENERYLYHTGESLNLTSEPMYYDVDLNAKYLCKEVLQHNKKIGNPFTSKERKQLKQFLEATENEKRILAEYSNRIYYQDQSLWNKWMHLPLQEQMNVAAAGQGDVR